MARVCMVVFSDYRSDGRVRREAEALIQRGDSVDCICVCDHTVKELDGVRLFSPTSYKYRGTNLALVFWGYLRFFCYAFFKAAVLHLKHPYDIFQAHTMPDFLVFAGLVPKLLGAKVILDVHDLMPEVYAVKFGSARRKRMVNLITWLEKRSVAFADKAMCVHEPHRQALAEHGNPREKFSVLLNVPDHRIFAPQKRAETWNQSFQLFYHGTTPKRAGLDVALQAVGRARREIPNLKFHIVGISEGHERITRLVQELNLSDCVTLTPPVPVDQLPALIAQADVGVVPYLDDAFTQYVLPTKLMEYAIVGIPAIVSRLRTVEAYFDPDMVSYFEPGNDIQFAEQIVMLYRHPEVARQRARNAAKFTEAYSWPQQREIYFGVVDSLVRHSEVLVNAN